MDSLEVPLPPGMDAIEVIRPREADDTEMERRAKFSWKADMYVTVDLQNLATWGAVHGTSEGSKTPDEVIGNPGVAGLQPPTPGKNTTFKIGPDCGWKADGDMDVEIYVDGSLVKTLNEKDLTGSCTFVLSIPATTDELRMEITSTGTVPYNGTAIWYLGSLVDKNTPWPQITVTRPAGKTIPAPEDIAGIFQWRWSNYFDGREKNMRDVLNVNVAGLAAWVGSDPQRATEIIYVEFDAPTGLGGYSNKAKDLLLDDSLDPAVRVINGSVLPSRLTIATDYPLYVRGDFNKTDWKPASLVGDAITILSTAWNDGEHQVQVVEKKNAAQTEVWAAILAGHSATPCDHEVAGCPGGYSDFYGGGIENFPRFLERWSGIQFIYRGSLVSLNVSQQAVGTWNGTYYSPPQRDWQFDTRFEDPQYLPPGTPVVGVVIRTAFRPVY
ncbi:MAG: hypothetical protein GTO22_02490 [Gemmatimonadales bacterium]|nr:hypothetical protein [Gemmatimonadales bacterium]